MLSEEQEESLIGKVGAVFVFERIRLKRAKLSYETTYT
ncbi:hypothetical protein Cs308_0054 [Candidatus Chlamydia sanziniae]|uniref:Uncharacterized protein n=1 Tax=Candidatus Chlamydia sanziniae TaxID=1806891 RepID=A0A1A9HTA9_9CHLA|nr:hypothetical protein Cs308_0054 [Candidatus Chlamydia sanziniae]